MSALRFENIPAQQNENKENKETKKKDEIKEPGKEEKPEKLVDLKYGDIFKSPDSDKLFKVTERVSEKVIKAKEVKINAQNKLKFVGEALEFDANSEVLVEPRKKESMEKIEIGEEKHKKLVYVKYQDIFKTPDSDKLFKITQKVSKDVIKVKEVEVKAPNEQKLVGEELEFDGNLEVLVEQTKKENYE